MKRQYKRPVTDIVWDWDDTILLVGSDDVSVNPSEEPGDQTTAESRKYQLNLWDDEDQVFLQTHTAKRRVLINSALRFVVCYGSAYGRICP